MRFELGFDCDNAAFDDDHRWEIARILREVAHRIDNDEDFSKGRNIIDINGNVVGQFVLVRPKSRRGK